MNKNTKGYTIRTVPKINEPEKKRKIIQCEKGQPTAQALEFFKKFRPMLGKIVRFQLLEYCTQPMRPDESFTPYPLRIIDECGNELRISCVTSGYAGAAPIAIRNILALVWKEIFNTQRVPKERIKFLAYSCNSFTLGSYPNKQF